MQALCSPVAALHSYICLMNRMSQSPPPDVEATEQASDERLQQLCRHLAVLDCGGLTQHHSRGRVACSHLFLSSSPCLSRLR